MKIYFSGAAIGQIYARTDKYKSTFYPHCLAEWENIDPETRNAPSLGVFKAKLNKIIRPTPKQVFGIHDPKGLATLTQLRVGLSALNFHKFRHNFHDTLNPMCPINDGVEDTEHFLLHCHSYHLQRNSLLSHVQATLLSCGLSNLSNEDLVSIILYGDEQRRHHGEDWGGHVLPNVFQDRFFNSSKSEEKYLGGGGYDGGT